MLKCTLSCLSCNSVLTSLVISRMQCKFFFFHPAFAYHNVTRLHIPDTFAELGVCVPHGPLSYFSHRRCSHGINGQLCISTSQGFRFYCADRSLIVLFKKVEDTQAMSDGEETPEGMRD